jgi:hypothetical protein
MLMKIIGSFGIVGWWTYRGIDPTELALHDVVVKQASSEEKRNLTPEVAMYKALNTTNSIHGRCSLGENHLFGDIS